MALSTGGGMIEVVEIDGAAVQLFGDYDVSLVQLSGDPAQALAWLEQKDQELAWDQASATGDSMLVIQGRSALHSAQLAEMPGFEDVRQLSAVLPVRSRRGLSVPFLHASELPDDIAERPLSDYALSFECSRGGIGEQDVFDQARRIHRIAEAGVAQGLAGTEYGDRILPRQSHRFAALLESGGLHEAGILNQAILKVSALMEVKSSMGVFVAAPTAGSCGTFLGTLLAAAEACRASEERTLRAILTGGLIGVFTATRSSFAAEVGGCQAETGAGAAMAAAALVELGGGSAELSLSAASHAFQNVLGLVCDPVANRVEAPCLGRNIAGASNAIASANMALAGYAHLIPLDEVLDAHREVSESMARELRCTALGGLSITPTSKAIEARLCGEGGCGSC